MIGAAALGIAGGLLTHLTYRRLSGKHPIFDPLDRLRLEWRPSEPKRVSEIVSDVTVCMTTVPSRAPFLGPTVASWLTQRLRPKRLELYVPRTSLREASPFVLPEWVMRHPLVTVVPCEDIGPATKVLWALKRHPPDARLLVADDDVLAPPTLLEDLVRARDLCPGGVVAGSGWRVPEDLTDRPTTLWSNLASRPPTPVAGTRLRGPRRVDVVQGTNAYLVEPRFFDVAVFDVDGAPAAVRWVDDVWLSAHLRVPRWVVPVRRTCFPRWRARRLFRETALGLRNRGSSLETRSNTIAIRHLEDRWMCRTLSSND